MSKIYEDDIEEWAIQLFTDLGYSYTHGAEIAPDGENSERETYSDLLLLNRLQDAARRINPNLNFIIYKKPLER